MEIIEVTSLQEGKLAIAEIEKASVELLKQMQDPNISNERHKELSDERYELKKAKRDVQSRMGKIFAMNRGVA